MLQGTRIFVTDCVKKFRKNTSTANKRDDSFAANTMLPLFFRVEFAIAKQGLVFLSSYEKD